ncbi:MAG: complex I NDUFA9 subunit family protein [Rhodocyclaceae bacterium]|nr:complex I NDUFA9 subunit family protein [Rhodocyclaceae bacterium]
MTNKKILLIGGTGFVGRHLARVLVDAGVQVTIPTRRYEKNRDVTMLPSVTLVEADINDEGALERLASGQDAVINLVGILHGDTPAIPYGKEFGAAHVELPKKIVAACKATGVKRLVHMSALHAAKNAPSEYLRSKAAGEEVVAQSGLVTTIFRPSVIFGARDSFINTFANLLRKLPFLPLGCAHARFQPVSVDDVAKAFAQALDTPAMEGQAYDLCGPNVYTLRELVEYTAEVLDLKRRIIPLSENFAYFQAALLSLLPNKMMSADNVRSMEIDSVCSGHCKTPPDWNPQPLEAIVPLYLLGAGDTVQFDDYRSRAGR